MIRGDWLENKKRDRRVPNSINIKRNGGIAIEEKKHNIIDYYYLTSNLNIKMRHFLCAKMFSLEKDSETSLITEKRGYSIIKKWESAKSFDVEILAEGDIRDIRVDIFFACGGKIEI